MRVTISVPTRQRYAKLEKCLELIVKNTKYPNYEIVVIIDKDDPESVAVARKFDTKILVKKRREMFVGKTNYAYHNTSAPLFIFLADDVEVQKNWLTEAVKTFDESFPDGMGLVSFQDEFDNRLAAHGLISRKYVETFLDDNIFHPSYVHYWCDCELTVRSKRWGRYAYSRRAEIIHNRPSKLGERDKIGQEGLTTKDSGRKLFIMRLWLNFPDVMPRRKKMELPDRVQMHFTPSEDLEFYIGFGIDTKKKLNWEVDKDKAEFLLSTFPLHWGSPQGQAWDWDKSEPPKKVNLRFGPTEQLQFYVGFGIDTRKKKEWEIDWEKADFLLSQFRFNWQPASSFVWLNELRELRYIGDHDICFQVWNRPEWTRKSLETLDKNTNWDLVRKLFIMDDNSDEETKRILEKYNNPKKVIVRENFGSSKKSLFKFTTLAKTPIVFNCENDILYPKNWNEIMAKEFDKDSSAGIVRGVSQDLPAHIHWSTALAGFDLSCLRYLLGRMAEDKRWMHGGWSKLLPEKWKLKCVPYLFFDKLDYHEEEFPRIDEDYRKGWSRTPADSKYRKKVMDLYEKRTILMDMNDLIVDGKSSNARTSMRPFIALLAGLVIAQDAKLVLEIGTGFLNSTKAFLCGLEKTGGKLVSCDPEKRWDGFYHSQFEFIQRKSQELAKDWRGKISILFIDGDHSYEQSKFDFDTFYPFVEDKGLIIFHDTNFLQHPVTHTGCEEVARGIKNLNKLDFLKKPGLMVFQKAN